MGSRQQKLQSLIESGVWSVLTELYVIMAAHVVEYPTSPRRASIQPAIKTEDEQGNVQNRAQIQNVPVIFLSSGTHTHSVGLSKDDEGILFFNQRSIDRWLDRGRTTDPEDSRMFHISDAFFLPCSLSGPATQAAFDSAAFVGMSDQSAGYKVENDGGLKIFKGSTDLIDKIKAKANAAKVATDDLLNETAATPYSAVDPNSGAWNTNAQGALEDLSTALEDLSNAAGDLQ